ncbi:MAG: hypothetical protein OEY55_12600 [Acidimicrobiia bacterium]|nr:hypothetical protein [Acidimicrobiia bacterium]MDH5503657.1 hypothetical protein [Acidimicrobiia bacterium]
MRINIVLLALLMVLGVACNRGDDAAGTTTLVTTVGGTASTGTGTGIGTGSGSATDSDPATDTTSTTAADTTGSVPLAVDPISFEVALQNTSADGVESLVVVVPNDEYTFDEMENLMRDIVDEYPQAESVRVVSDIAAVNAAARYNTDTALAEDTALLDEHLLVELVDGIRLVFRGPYEPMGEASLGS